MAVTTKQKETLKEVILIIDDAIKEAGEFGIPNGHLFAMVMGVMSLELYQQIIAGMVDAGAITNKNNLLVTRR
ncbi:MAG: hypothetical protein KAR20_26400 [Candidatus Heimdallarchaeota archaeon]|nr:hypothetical protein [Candidatus Heimdallarchaeota archaeon]